jgi:ABC-type transport system substrate-binding protein
MPDNPMAPSLATQWQESPDGLTYDFELRQGVQFHNGDPFTAEDVKFSFERYKGTSAGDLKQKVKAVEIVNASSMALCRWSHTPTIPRKPSNSSLRPAILMASTLGTGRSISASQASVRRWSTT